MKILLIFSIFCLFSIAGILPSIDYVPNQNVSSINTNNSSSISQSSSSVNNNQTIINVQSGKNYELRLNNKKIQLKIEPNNINVENSDNINIFINNPPFYVFEKIGWHLIGAYQYFPIEIFNHECVDIIWQYNHFWSKYIPLNKQLDNNLIELKQKDGFWIKINHPCIIY